jgi:intein/homing endonuclease/type IV secretory pathway ATPase VirB11/archaellum biosynthesis ATPase
MLFKPGTPIYAFEVEKEAEQDVMYINYLGAPYVPDIANSGDVMSRVVDYLIKTPNISRIVFVQQRNYSYDFSQVLMLQEIANLYIYLTKQEKILSPNKLGTGSFDIARRYEFLGLLLNLLKSNPIACYVSLKNNIFTEKNALEKMEPKMKNDSLVYIRTLEKFYTLMSNLSLIKAVENKLNDYDIGDRSIYSSIFRPDIIPNFTFTRLVASLPKDAEIIDQYEIGEGYDTSSVTIFKKKEDVKYFYHLMPPEYSLNEGHHLLLNLARNVLIEHQPKAEEFTDPERVRQVFFNVSRDLLQELAESQNVKLSYSDLNKLAMILVRHTIGFGLVEVLLKDKELQDIVLNAPITQNPVFLRHNKYDECSTNILPSQEDADSWAAKFRMISGRPLDEANPILDTDLSIGDIRARIAVIQQPLSPSGLAYAIRRHRESPWTLPLFIKNKMLNSFSAGLMSFLVDGARCMLVSGTRSSGKTSLLGSLMLEIMPKYRVITIEDSVVGESKILIKQKENFKKIRIDELIDEQIKKYGSLDILGKESSPNLENIKIFCIDKKGRVVLSKPNKFFRHRVTKPLYEIITASGRKISVTEDHSLFSFDEQNILKEIKPTNLKSGGYIAIPSILPLDNSLDYFNFSTCSDKFNKKIFVLGKGIKNYISKNRKDLFSLAYSSGYKKSTIQNWIKKKILPLEIFNKVKNKIAEKELFIKTLASSGSIPFKIVLDEVFLNFIGLWIADGCYDKNSVILSVQEEENKNIAKKIAKRFNIPLKSHSDKFSLMLNSSIFKEVLINILGLRGNAYTKKIPSWAYNLSEKQIGWLLKGFFSGDGHVSNKEIEFSSCSAELLEDISTLLLKFGIILRTSGIKVRDKTFRGRIGSTREIRIFKENIGFLTNFKKKRLDKLSSRISTHDTSDIIPLSLEMKKKLNKIFHKRFSYSDYIARNRNVGRKYLSNLLTPKMKTSQILTILKKSIDSDIFWDKVKKIKKINFEGFVYDISVPECENFICNNILAHNTMELPIDALRKLKYDILRMKVRSALLTTTTEVAADEGIRTSLRLGDSCLIVGEVRSSIRGNEEVVIVEEGIMKRVQIKDLEDKELKNILVPTIDFNLKNKLSKLSGFVKHPKRDKLLRIKTKTGREITVTHDHSLFSPTKNFEIAPIECKNLEVGSQIVIPSYMPCGFNDKNNFNLLDYLEDFRIENFEEDVKRAIKVLGWKKATEICEVKTGDIYNYFRRNQKTNIPYSSFVKLMKSASLDWDFKNLKIKRGTSLSLPAIIPLNKDFCRFLGYYVSEGYYSLGECKGGKVIISNSNPEVIEDIRKISKNLFGFEQKTRVVKGLGTSIQHQFNCLPLAEFISKLDCGRTCYEKRAPSFIFGLSKEKIASFLRGLYSGDGCFTSSKSSGNCIKYFSTSRKLVEDVAYLLLNFGIIATIRNKPPRGIGKHEIWSLEFKDREMVEIFLKEIGFNRKIPEKIVRKWKHTIANSVRFDRTILREHLIKYPRKYRHLFRFLQCSKNYLREVVLDSKCKVSEKLRIFALGDFFLDEIKEVEEIILKEGEYVYDLSIEPTQNFIGGFGGILLHNTEARALYEAMRVGALANVVAGTIHGASPYGVFDRVVNDLNVPVTSFKATDCIIVANPVKTADGLHSVRRVLQLTEVRKHWTKDPLEEKGFVDLLKYDVDKDSLEASDDLINGDSEIIKDIASGVKGWAGNWDAIYDNIILRGKVKQELVELAEKLKKPTLLEAGFVVLSNNMFHQISDSIREEIGLPISKRVFPEWQKWCLSAAKKI